MPVILTSRDQDSRELMDDPNCDPEALNNTYGQFSVVNSMISRWYHIYRTRIRPLFNDPSRQYSILDIGFGGGDIPRKLARWASKDNIELSVIGIETDLRAYRYATAGESPDNVHYLYKSSEELISMGLQFDVVISNHLLHHLDSEAFHSVLTEARQLSRQAVFFNDIKRSDVGYVLFNLLSRPVFRSSFITSDGLTSIKRSYTFRELQEKAPEGWDVQRLFPFRLLLSYHHA